MFSYHSNYFKVVINMSQVPIDLSPSPLPHARMGGGGGLLNCSTVYEGRARAEKHNFLVKTVQKMPFLACLFLKKISPVGGSIIKLSSSLIGIREASVTMCS